MRIFILTLMILSNCILVFGQNTINYTYYFEQILKAEDELADGNYDKALETYSKTLKQYNFVFASDAYNACQIGLFIKNNKIADSLFYLCSKSGISKKRLLTNHLILRKYLSDTIKYNSLLVAGKKAYFKRIDQSLRNEMLSQFNQEQNAKDKGTINDFREVCSSNFDRILSLAKKGRFPGEKLIGVNDDLNNNFVFSTLCNYPNSYKLIIQYLDTAMKYGEVQPIQIIVLYCFNQSRINILYSNKNNNKYHVQYDSLNFKTCYNISFGKRSNDIDSVNIERKKANIFSVETQEKLLKLAKQDTLDFKFGD